MEPTSAPQLPIQLRKKKSVVLALLSLAIVAGVFYRIGKWSLAKARIAKAAFQMKGGLILDSFKHGKPNFYLWGVDARGNGVPAAGNLGFDLWSLGPNRAGRGDLAPTLDDLANDIINW